MSRERIPARRSRRSGDAERCPVFPGAARVLQWSFEDPSAFEGTEEQRLARTAEVRDRIEAAVKSWIAGFRGTA
jgi:hypothetical protein